MAFLDNYCGIRVFCNSWMQERTPRTLSKKVDVPDDFRAYINEWMASFPLLEGAGELYYIYDKRKNVIYAHPRCVAELKKAIATQEGV